MILLGFGFRAQNGKSSACDAILERCNYSSWKAGLYSIGEEVRRWCVTERLLPDVVREALTDEQVQVLARVGKERRDKEGESIWLDAISARIEADKCDVALIPNIRYRNEAEFVNNKAGFTVLVLRRNANGSPFISMSRNANHQSETDLYNWNWDFTLTHKEGQEWWLRAQAVNLFNFLHERRTKSATAKGF